MVLALKPGKGRLRKAIVNEIVINGALIKSDRAASPPLCQRCHCGGEGGSGKGDKDTGRGGGHALNVTDLGLGPPRDAAPF